MGQNLRSWDEKKKKKKKIKILTSQCENSSRDTCFQECLGGLVTAKSPNSSAALWNSGTPRNLFHCISNPSTKNSMHIFHYLEQTFKNLANCPYKSKRKKPNLYHSSKGHQLCDQSDMQCKNQRLEINQIFFFFLPNPTMPYTHSQKFP